MKVAFYKNNSHLFNRLVAWWTKGPYSHVELVFDDNFCASSSNRDNGVRYKYIKFNPDNWDVFQLNGFDEVYAQKFIAKNLGKKYDIKGLFGFVWAAAKDNPRKYFCSELVMGALGFPEPWRFSPNTCYAVLRRHFNA